MVSFEVALNYLRHLRSPKFWEAATMLERLLTTVSCARVLLEFAPERYQFLSGDGCSLLMEYGDLHPYEEAAFEVANNQVPLDYWHMERELINWEGGRLMCALPFLGFPFSYDEMLEIIDNPSDVDSNLALEIFLKYLDIGVVGEATWEIASEYFEWDIDPRAVPDWHQYGFDMERFVAELEKRNLGIFASKCKLVWGVTGIPLLDFQPDDYINGDDLSMYRPFNSEAVRDFAEQWEQGKPILEEAKAADQLASRDSSVFSGILDAFKQALEPVPPSKPKTLVEQWTPEDGGFLPVNL